MRKANKLKADGNKDERTYCPSWSKPSVSRLYFSIPKGTVLRGADIFSQLWDLVEQSMLSQVRSWLPILHM